MGTLARWWVSQAFGAAGFPWATLFVNVTGAFGLGLAGVLLIERLARFTGVRAFVTIGLFGSYTTFSTMAVEGIRLMGSGEVGTALGYWSATLVLGLAAGAAGVLLGRRYEMRRDRV